MKTPGMSGAILTGSRAYGTPREESDYDLVVLVSEEEFAILEDIAEPPPEAGDPEYGGESVHIIKQGKLNLIVTCDPVKFAVWQKGTMLLKEESPVTRNRAVSIFKGLRGRHGVLSK